MTGERPPGGGTVGPVTGPPSPTTLAEHLRSLDDTALARGVAARLAHLDQVPGDLDTLARSLQQPWVVSAAQADLDRFALLVLREVSVRSGPRQAAARSRLESALPGVETARLDAELTRLSDLLLVWPSGEELWSAPTSARTRTDVGPPQPDPPDLDAADEPAAPQADEVLVLVDRVDAVVRAVRAAPLEQVRAGGVAVKELRRLAKQLRLEADDVAQAVQLAGDAGLLVAKMTRSGPGPVVVADSRPAWQEASAAERVAWLTTGWLVGRAPLEGRRAGGSGPRPLAEVWGAATLPSFRRAVLRAADGRAADLWKALSAGSWHSPLAFEHVQDHDVTTLLVDTARLGLTGPDRRLTSVGVALSRALAEGADADGCREALRVAWETVLPEPVDRLLLVPDLTAVVPGPPRAALRALLDDVADRESSGAGAVWRFSAGSVGRGLDLGHDAEGLLAELESRSGGSVPSTLRALVGDVAATHGRVRVREARSVLVCADEATAQRLLTTRFPALPGGLQQVAPTVLVARTAVAGPLVAALRASGHLAVLEDASGAAVVGDGRKAPQAPPLRLPSGGDSLFRRGVEVHDVDALVARLRAADRRRPSSGPGRLAPLRPGDDPWPAYDDPVFVDGGAGCDCASCRRDPAGIVADARALGLPLEHAVDVADALIDRTELQVDLAASDGLLTLRVVPLAVQEDGLAVEDVDSGRELLLPAGTVLDLQRLR